MEADTFATALEGWKASLEECGDYESHKDYEFEASSTGVTVTAPAHFLTEVQTWNSYSMRI